MDGDNKKLPDLPKGEDLEAMVPSLLKDDEWFDIDISNDWLNVEDEYVKPEWTLAYDGVPFAPLGGIHALTGQPGHGKTMTFTQMMVAVLKGSYGQLTYELSDTHPNPKVLYIDTEMEKGNTQLVNLRVYTMMGWTYRIPHDEFKVIMLRETENAEDRWRKTLKAIWEVKPTVCFIDGLLDVVHDFNKNDECAAIIYKCMKVASHYGISLWCLVHENPGSTKMVGHMGSILERKVTDAIGTIKKKDDATGEVTFTVKQKKARGKDLKDWTFKVVDDAHKFGIPEQPQEGAEGNNLDILKPQPPTLSEVINKLITRSEGITTRDLLDGIKHAFRVGATKAEKLIWQAEDEQLIMRDEHKRYHLAKPDVIQTTWGNPDEKTDDVPY